MKTEVVVALIAGLMALVSAGVAVWGSITTTRQTAENSRAIEELKIANERLVARTKRESEISKFSEPLARSAYDLQSRIYNILKQGLIAVYLTRGNERERKYVVENTVFLIGQYLCWTELARREIQFIDLGENEKTRMLLHLQDKVHSLWGTDGFPPTFRIFAGEQRALGEALIQVSSRGPECMGYGAFLKELAPGANPLIDALRADVHALGTGLAAAVDRLKSVQNALIDLLALLDPDYIRFPADRRTKV